MVKTNLKMKEKLLTSLEMVLKNLKEKKLTYDWDSHGSCNVGLVVSCLLGKSPYDLQNAIDLLAEPLVKDDPTDWKGIISYYCPLSGLSSNMIFRRLQIAGMSREDMINLEYLSDPIILERTKRLVSKDMSFLEKIFSKNTLGTKDISYDNSGDFNEDYYMEEENLIIYLEAWIELIKEDNLLKNSNSALKPAEQSR